MKRCLLAPHVFTGEGALVADGAVVVDEDGNVLDVGTRRTCFRARPARSSSAFAGLLMPGLVNAHTHLELSHLRGKVAGRRRLLRVGDGGLLAARAASMDEDASSAADRRGRPSWPARAPSPLAT